MSLPFHMRAPNQTHKLRLGDGSGAKLTGPVNDQGFTHELDRDPGRYRFFLSDVPDFIRISDTRRQR